jgi:hypothetical protein
MIGRFCSHSSLEYELIAAEGIGVMSSSILYGVYCDDSQRMDVTQRQACRDLLAKIGLSTRASYSADSLLVHRTLRQKAERSILGVQSEIYRET